MKNLDLLNPYRVEHPAAGWGDSYNGAFKIYVKGRAFYVIASNGEGWEHVSVCLKNHKRCPTWDEMCAIKDMFFESHEVVMQLHPSQKEYVNVHPYCLHLWRPLEENIPTPPIGLV